MGIWLVRDVMSTNVFAVAEDASYREIVDILLTERVSAVPVVDGANCVVGVVSAADLLRKVEFAGGDGTRHISKDGRMPAGAKGAGEWATDLMTKPAITAVPETSIIAAALRMDDHSVKRLPVIDDLGRLVGIVTRCDLLRVFRRPDDAIRNDIIGDVLHRRRWLDPELVGVEVTAGIVTFTGWSERRSHAKFAVRLTRGVPALSASSTTSCTTSMTPTSSGRGSNRISAWRRR